MARPTAAELAAARSLIARAKAADPNLKRADELLVCAAMAVRAGECDANPTRCARLMGKEISKPKSVMDWVSKIETLERASPPPEVGTDPTSAPLLVQPEWIQEHLPSVELTSVGELFFSPGRRHAKRTLEVMVTSFTQESFLQGVEIDYELPPTEGESEEDAKRRKDRHRRREERALRSLVPDDDSVLDHKEAEAERQCAFRVDRREIVLCLDDMITQLEYDDLALQPLAMPPRGADCWLVGPWERPRFNGETIWCLPDANYDALPLPLSCLEKPSSMAWSRPRPGGYVLAASGESCAPVALLARIECIYANYSGDVRLLNMDSMEFTVG